MVFCLARKQFRKRAALAVLFLSPFASCSRPATQWDFDKAVASCAEFSSAKLTRHSQNLCNGLEIEIAQGTSGLQMYVNAFSLQIPSSPKNSAFATLQITIDNCEQEIAAYRLKGGQRLLIPEKARDEIINALLENKPVILSTGCYREIINPDDFAYHFAKLKIL